MAEQTTASSQEPSATMAAEGSSSKTIPPEESEITVLQDANVALEYFKVGADENLQNLILEAQKNYQDVREGPQAQLRQELGA